MKAIKMRARSLDRKTKVVYNITMDSPDGNSGHNPSSKKIAVTVESELEPVNCEGEFIRVENGFVMRFFVGSDKYEITHNDKSTRLTVTGVLSYAMDFCDNASPVALKTPFGDTEFELVPERREAELSEEKVKIALDYKLIGGGAENSRSVNVIAEFK